MNSIQHSASFRDPSGFVFRRDGVLYRQVNSRYASEYDHLMESGLYDHLTKAGRLIPCKEVKIPPAQPEISYKVIQPEEIPFISYPYEWSFSQLKDAALMTLAIQKVALKYGMSLKDASAYNIQFVHGKAALIDTLSFDIYKEGQPWVAYRQFCQHFLAPLVLMAKTDIRLGQLLRVYIDGVPLDLASRLLPVFTWLNIGLTVHIYLHAKMQAKHASEPEKTPQPNKEMSKRSFLAMIDNLINTVRKLDWHPQGTEWSNYYEITNYHEVAFQQKEKYVSEWVAEKQPEQVWDLGANNGVFSRLSSEQGIYTLSFDIDPAAVEQNYRQVKQATEKNILPLVLDLTNPSPAIGWNNRERQSFSERAPADMVLALALIHHLAISNNVPLAQLAEFFSGMGKWLVIEFVPKSDSQVVRMLQSRVDIFDAYSREAFEQEFETHFIIHQKIKIDKSHRFLYLMERR